MRRGRVRQGLPEPSGLGWVLRGDPAVVAVGDYLSLHPPFRKRVALSACAVGRARAISSHWVAVNLCRRHLTPTATISPPIYPAGQLPGGLDFRGLDAGMADDLAQCYLMSYPPDVAASDLDEAREEMNATFRGDYGELRAGAITTAWVGGRLAGAIMVVTHSVWDEHLSLVRSSSTSSLIPTHAGRGSGGLWSNTPSQPVAMPVTTLGGCASDRAPPMRP